MHRYLCNSLKINEFFSQVNSWPQWLVKRPLVCLGAVNHHVPPIISVHNAKFVTLQ